MRLVTSGPKLLPLWREGPAAEVWYYASKELYLRSALAQCAVLFAAALSPIVTSTPLKGVLVMGGLLVGGMLSLPWLLIG